MESYTQGSRVAWGSLLCYILKSNKTQNNSRFLAIRDGMNYFEWVVPEDADDGSFAHDSESHSLMPLPDVFLIQPAQNCESLTFGFSSATEWKNAMFNKRFFRKQNSRHLPGGCCVDTRALFNHELWLQDFMMTLARFGEPWATM